MFFFFIFLFDFRSSRLFFWLLLGVRITDALNKFFGIGGPGGLGFIRRCV